MSLDRKNTASGLVMETPGGFVYEIGNGSITRRIQSVSGHIETTSLVNGVNAEEYLDETSAEFEITIAREGQSIVLTSNDFEHKVHETRNWDDNKRTLALKLQADLNGKARRRLL